MFLFSCFLHHLMCYHGYPGILFHLVWIISMKSFWTIVKLICPFVICKKKVRLQKQYFENRRPCDVQFIRAFQETFTEGNHKFPSEPCRKAWQRPRYHRPWLWGRHPLCQAGPQESQIRPVNVSISRIGFRISNLTHDMTGIQNHLRRDYVSRTSFSDAILSRTILSASMMVWRRCATVMIVTSDANRVLSVAWIVASVL